MKVEALAIRSGRWWAVEIRDVDGGFTQVKRLDQVADAVRDAVALLEEVPQSSVEVEVSVVIADTIAAQLDTVADDRHRAERLAREASERLASAARELTGQGLTTRDVGFVLGVSHQRVAQILAARPTESSAAPAAARRYVPRSALPRRVRGRH